MICRIQRLFVPKAVINYERRSGMEMKSLVVDAVSTRRRFIHPL